VGMKDQRVIDPKQEANRICSLIVRALGELGKKGRRTGFGSGGLSLRSCPHSK